MKLPETLRRSSFFVLLLSARLCRRHLPKNYWLPVVRMKPSMPYSSKWPVRQPTPNLSTCSAAAYFMLEEWDRGITACESARDLDPQKSLYHLWLGRIYGEKAARVSFLSAAGLAKKVRIFV